MPDPRPALIRRGSAAARPAGASTAVLKAVVRQLLALDDGHTVVIQQLACAEPDCPRVETVVAVLSADAPPRRWTLHRPLADVTADDIRTALTQTDHKHDQGEQQ